MNINNYNTIPSMKKTFLLLLFAAFSLSAYAEGISNYKELVAFINDVNNKANLSSWKNEHDVVCFKADIDMSKAKKIPQLKNLEFEIDGCGHKLYNWNASRGLIKNIAETGILKNLTIDNSCVLKIDINFNTEPIHVGFFADASEGRIINCVNNGFIEHTGEGLSNNIYIGGIVGYNHNLVYNCKNTGKISSNIASSTPSKEMRLRIAGIAAVSGGIIGQDIGIYRCENTGIISSFNDFPNVHVSGIVGDGGPHTMVKYCVNRGNVAAISTPCGNGKGFIRIAGVVTWTGGDIVACDNFGNVSSSGSSETFTSGIAACPAYTALIAGCINYGKVTSNTSAASYTAGVAAHSSGTLQITNCVNYGEIACMNKGDRYACIGGIGAGYFLGKGVKKGTTFRNCVNYGKVLSVSTNTSGGVGGIAGLTHCIKNDDNHIRHYFYNCANKGSVKSENNPPKEICGKPGTSIIKGEFNDTWAKYVKPLKDGTNVYGRILDTDGNPVQGVIVSDGEQSVLTDVSGGYAMKSRIGTVRFVQISVPAKYEVPTVGNMPQFFLRIPRYAEAVRADFTLKKRESVSDKFTLALIGDPQINGFGIGKSTTRLRDEVLTDIAKLQESKEEPLYAIALGNLVADGIKLFQDYVDIVGTAKFPMFNVIGQHDHFHNNILETVFSAAVYENYIAPVNYSFNIGKMHFVVVDSSICNRPTGYDKYTRGLEESTCKWLESDLKFVSKDQTIVLCSNAPLLKNRYNFGLDKVNYDVYSKLLSEYNKVYALNGFMRQNYSYNYQNEKTPEQLKHLSNVEVISVARCLGQPHLNRELTNDGTPNGYMVAEIDGDKMEWYYKTLKQDRNYQMRAYTPATNKGGWVKVTIWNHSPEGWTTPEWWENGVKVADMTCVSERDIDYMKIYEAHKKQKLVKWPSHYSHPVNAPFIFRVKPTEGVTAGEIRVTDNFGVTYTQEVKW